MAAATALAAGTLIGTAAGSNSDPGTIQELRAQITAIEAERDMAKAERDAGQAQITSLEARIDELEQEVEDLLGQLEGRTMPNLLGQSIDSAESAVSEREWTLTTVLVQGTEPDEIVTKQVPAPGSAMNPDSEVTLTVATPTTVTQVIDGDTIDVTYLRQPTTVRLIGIDAPEPGACYGQKSKVFVRSEIEGELIRLTFDQDPDDPFDRTLAYVWRGDELFNETVVAEGYATILTIQPNDKYVGRLSSAEEQAKDAQRGLWTACVEPTTPPPPPCDPSYPDVCIPPYPPDLDCGEINFTDFRVVGSDPHGFDGDDDGIGCES